MSDFSQVKTYIIHMEVQSSVLTPVSPVVAVRPPGDVQTTWTEHAKPFKALSEYELGLTLA